jgi:hypothetical protein
VSVCHCLACQRRTGSAFGVQARFLLGQVHISGSSRDFIRHSDDGEARVFSFCPECGATVYYRLGSAPEVIAIPVGAFADPEFSAPRLSVWESRKHPWVTFPTAVERG